MTAPLAALGGPLILEVTARVESAWLAAVCLLLAAALALLLFVVLPIARGRAYRAGLDRSDPTLARERDRYHELWRGRGEHVERLERDLRDTKATLAIARGLAADIARRATDATHVAEAPSEREAHVLRIGARR